MIGLLPTSLNVNGVNYDIRTDYRDCLLLLQVMADDELCESDKLTTFLRILYKNNVPEDLLEAYNKGCWFLDLGKTETKPITGKPVYDWEQDEQMIFSSINKVAGREVRADKYLHWWTFMALFNEIGEGTFSTVVSIRSKKQKGKKLDKWEQDFYKNNKDVVDLKRKYTAAEQAELDALNEMLS